MYTLSSSVFSVVCQPPHPFAIAIVYKAKKHPMHQLDTDAKLYYNSHVLYYFVCGGFIIVCRKSSSVLASCYKKEHLATQL